MDTIMREGTVVTVIVSSMDEYELVKLAAVNITFGVDWTLTRNPYTATLTFIHEDHAKKFLVWWLDHVLTD